MAYLFSLLGKPRLYNEWAKLISFKVLSFLEIASLFLNLPDFILGIVG